MQIIPQIDKTSINVNDGCLLIKQEAEEKHVIVVPLSFLEIFLTKINQAVLDSKE